MIKWSPEKVIDRWGAAINQTNKIRGDVLLQKLKEAANPPVRGERNHGKQR
jgi:hypothetical protein|tara:strand:+ start:3712 stop:3864 length:153 start_codon:yes stop_codon:yes gene_type:complete